MYEGPNYVQLVGTVEKLIVLHPWQEGDSLIELRVKRATFGKSDLLKVSVQNLDIPYVRAGMKIKVTGNLYMHENIRKAVARWTVRVFARQVEIVDEDCDDMNIVSLIGKIRKVGQIRVTPLSLRELLDFQVMTCSWKDEFIPTIAWGPNAYFVKNIHDKIPYGNVAIIGRLQERQFMKKHYDGRATQETVYEVSARSVCFTR